MKKAFNVYFFPILKDIESYKFSFFKSDSIVALYIALLTIPQAIACSFLAGLPPEAGLFSAIFGSIFTASFSSSKFLIGGPSTGIAILIQSALLNTLDRHFLGAAGVIRETLAMHILAQIVLIMGLVQVISGFLNVGRLLQFVSRSVMLGYFTGVMLAVFTSQLFYFLGITPKAAPYLISKVYYLLLHFKEIKWINFGFGIFSVLIFFFFKRKMKRIPDALMMFIVTGLISFFLAKFFPRFSVSSLSETMQERTFSFRFVMPGLDFDLMQKVFPAAIAIAFVAIIEASLASRSLAVKSGENINSSQQAFALGIANLVISFVRGALPASGSILRSFLNFQKGAKTRFSAVFSGCFVTIAILFLWPFVKFIPLVSLAALVMIMIAGILEKEELKICFRARRSDMIVFLLTLLSCLFFELYIAFFIGVVISLAFYLKKAAIPTLVEYSFNAAGRLVFITKKPTERKIRIIGIEGELFFGAVDLFQNALQKIADDLEVRVIILRLEGVRYMDASMCIAILQLNELLRATNRHLLISGITPAVWKVFLRASVVRKMGTGKLFLSDKTKPQQSTWRAYLHAQHLIS